MVPPLTLLQMSHLVAFTEIVLPDDGDDLAFWDPVRVQLSLVKRKSIVRFAKHYSEVRFRPRMACSMAAQYNLPAPA